MKRIVCFILLFLFLPYPLAILYINELYLRPKILLIFLPFSSFLAFYFAILFFFSTRITAIFTTISGWIYAIFPLVYLFLIFLLSSWATENMRRLKKSLFVVGAILITVWLSCLILAKRLPRGEAADIRRRSDLLVFKKAMERYYEKNSRYPQSSIMPYNLGEFLPKVPKDPKGEPYGWNR